MDVLVNQHHPSVLELLEQPPRAEAEVLVRAAPPPRVHLPPLPALQDCKPLPGAGRNSGTYPVTRLENEWLLELDKVWRHREVPRHSPGKSHH